MHASFSNPPLALLERSIVASSKACNFTPAKWRLNGPLMQVPSRPRERYRIFSEIALAWVKSSR